MQIIRQVIMLCILLLCNYAGFATLNLQNQHQHFQRDFQIELNDQTSLDKIKQLKLSTQSDSLLQTNKEDQNNQELDDINISIQTNTKNVLTNQLNQYIEINQHQNPLSQEEQLQNIDQSQLLISEDYEVINIKNPIEVDILDSHETQNLQQVKAIALNHSDNHNFQNDQIEFNNQEQNNLKETQQIINQEITTFDDEIGFISDEPQQFNVNNTSKEYEVNQNDMSEQINQEYHPFNSSNSLDQDVINIDQLQSQVKKDNDNKNENDCQNKNENQLLDKIENYENISQSQQTDIDPSSIIIPQQQEKIDQKLDKQDYEDGNIKDSLKVGYIIENNVETDDYLKDIQNDEKSSQKQLQDMKRKLEKEEQQLNQLKIIKQDDENKLKEIQEQEKLFYDLEQNEEQQIEKLNQQLEIHQQELEKYEADNKDTQVQTKNEKDIQDQTQFRPYEGQDLIISSEINYDEGNIEQFENNTHEEMIVENYQRLELKIQENDNNNWNQNKQSYESFQQNLPESENDTQKEEVLNFDKSISAQPQEITIDFNNDLKTIKSQINLSYDILVINNNKQLNGDNSESSNIYQNIVDDSKNKVIEGNYQSIINSNSQSHNNQNQNIDLLNQNENDTISKSLNEDLQQDEEKQIKNLEVTNQNNIEVNEKKIIFDKSEINLSLNTNTGFSQNIQNYNSIPQSENMIQSSQYNQEHHYDSSFYQVQSQLQRLQGKTSQKDSIIGSQNSQKGSLFQKGKKISNINQNVDAKNQNQQHFNVYGSAKTSDVDNQMKVMVLNNNEEIQEIPKSIKFLDKYENINQFEK